MIFAIESAKTPHNPALQTTNLATIFGKLAIIYAILSIGMEIHTSFECIGPAQLRPNHEDDGGGTHEGAPL